MPGPTRTLLLCALAMTAACKDSEFILPDASFSSDGALGYDATVGPGSVTVTVVVSGVPVTGALVAFQNPDGSTIGIVTTGADGVATQVVPYNSTVQVGEPPGTASPNYWSLTTILGVKPGDNLTVGTPADSNPAVVGTDNVSVAAQYPNTNFSEAYFGCNNGLNPTVTPTTIPVILTADCLDASQHFAASAIAFDNNNKAIAYTDATSLSLAGNPGSATTHLPAWTAAGQTSIYTFNIPSTATYAYATHTHMRGNLPYESQYANSGGVPNYSYSAQFGAPTDGFYDSAIDTVELDFGYDDTDYQAASFHYARDPALTSANVDASEFLPRVSDVYASTHNDGTTSIDWTGSLAGADGATVTYTWQIMPDAGIYDEYVWGIVFPPGPSSTLSLPKLPAELAAYAPPVNQALNLQRFFAVRSSALGSYDRFRPIFSKMFTVAFANAPDQPIVPGNFVAYVLALYRPG